MTNYVARCNANRRRWSLFTFPLKKEGPDLKPSTLNATGYRLSMKRAAWLLGLGVFLFALIAVIWMHLPREVDVRLEGVKYRLGRENASLVEPAAIHIEGTVRRTLKGHRLFRER